MQNGTAAAKSRPDPSEIKKRLEAAFGTFDRYSAQNDHRSASIFGGGPASGEAFSSAAAGASSCSFESLRVGGSIAVEVQQQPRVQVDAPKARPPSPSRQASPAHERAPVAKRPLNGRVKAAPEKKPRMEELLRNFEDVSPLLSPVRPISPPAPLLNGALLKQQLQPQQSAEGNAPRVTLNGTAAGEDSRCRLDLSALAAKQQKLLADKWTLVRRLDSPATAPAATPATNGGGAPMPTRVEAVAAPAVDGDAQPKAEAMDRLKPATAPTGEERSASPDGRKLDGELMARSMPTASASVEEHANASVEHYERIARKIKRERADVEKDRIKKTFSYLQATVYFTLSAASLCEQPERAGGSRHGLEALIHSIKQFVGGTTSHFIASRAESAHLNYYRARVRMLTHALNACLEYRLYHARSAQALSNHETLSQYERDVAGKGGAGSKSEDARSAQEMLHNATPSPAPSTASTGSSGRSANAVPREMVAVPADIHALHGQQHRTLGHLLMAHRHWGDAFEAMSDEDRAFTGHLNRLCGPLRVDSSLRQLAVFLATAVKWMTRQYELQLGAKRP